MRTPSDYPIRWSRGFGWGSWRAVWRLVFPPDKVFPGYTLLKIKSHRPWLWPYWKIQRLRWAMRGPLS